MHQLAVHSSKCQLKTPVLLESVSTAKSGMVFFNSNIGSRISDYQQIPFKYENDEIKTVEQCHQLPTKTIVDVIGNLKWTDDTREVMCGLNKDQKRKVRDAVLADETKSIPVSIWNELIDQIDPNITYHFKNLVSEDFNGTRLSSTACTELLQSEKKHINWKDFNTAMLKSICFPTMLSIRFNRYFNCLKCGKKVIPHAGENRVRCTADKCGMLMPVERCKSSFCVDMFLMDSKSPEEQQTITFFLNAVQSLIDVTDKSDREIEDAILTIEKFDVQYNKKRIAVAANIHE